MAGVIHIQWYATVMRHERLAALIAAASPIALRYGATRYAVHQSHDDRYKIVQMIWFESETDWHRFWDGPDMIAFRRRNSGMYQIPITYIWHGELAHGALGPEVPLEPEPEPEPEPTPQAAA
jgi:hypothetical protein